jgi:transposase
MRGRKDEQPGLFHVFNVEERIRPDHPLRDVKRRVDRILEAMSPDFARSYSRTGRPSVPPERLLKAMLIMGIYSIRSERQLCERLGTDLLFRWFLDMQPSEEAFDHAVFAHNRERLREHELTKRFFDAVVSEALTANLCSEHFSVDGTMIESFASAKSFQPKPTESETNETKATPVAGEPDARENDSSSGSALGSTSGPPSDANSFKPRNPDVDFHGQKRTNETHQSRTDPEAKLHRKGPGKEAKLSHMGHALTENRNGLVLGITVTEANGTAERDAALDLLDDLKATHKRQPKTLGADKGYDSGEFLQELESRKIEPHVPLVKEPCDPEKATHKQRQPGIEARHRMKERQTTEGYRLSQKCRKKIEEVFGWFKEIADLGRARVVGRWKILQSLEMGAAAYNLIRLRKLKPA